MKGVRFIFILALFQFMLSTANAQYSAFVRNYFFEGDLGEAFKSGIGGGFSYCGGIQEKEQFEFAPHMEVSFCHVSPVADTMPTEAYANGILIPGSWESYSKIWIFSIDWNALIILSNSEHWKPFAAGGFTFQYLGFDYDHYVPGVIDGSVTNDFMAGFSFGPAIGTYYFFNDVVGVTAKAQQTWGWVYKEGPVRVNFNAFDISAGLTLIL